MGEILNKNINKDKAENNGNNKYSSGKTIKKLPLRTFEVRDSLLTTLCENPHIKVVKHIFIASLVGLFLNTVMHDIFEHGEFRVGFKVISAGMGGLHWVAIIWIGLNLCSSGGYFCFKIWANARIRFLPKQKLNMKLWDSLWLFMLVAYYACQFKLVALWVGYMELPVGSTAILCLEQTRLLMKLHAFVRHNSEKVVNFKPHSDHTLKVADFSHYVYFLFAPTLVYRDDYPRRESIRWKFVMEKVFELVGVIFYYAFLFERFTIPDYKDIGIRPYTVQELILKALDSLAVGLMFLLLAFYAVLDITQNLFGELLKFGDRQFYKEWWTSTNYSEYFRTWNIVVGDWLYTYIYKDMYEHVFPGSKTLAKITVFILSAIVHEWVVTTMFGFFLPALFLAFTFVGGVLSFIPIPKMNVVNVAFWYMLALGCGLLSSLYTAEYFIRTNVPVENPSFVDFIVPRLFTCDCIVY